MITASQMRAGMVVRHEGQTYKVLAAEYHPGQGKMGGVTHAHLRNLATGTHWEHSFRADLKLEDKPVERSSMEFLYADGPLLFFMNPDTFDQVEIPASLVGEQARFLSPQMKLPVEFVEGRPISVVFPEQVEIRIADTAPPTHAQQDSAWKQAKLENGVEILVPQFIRSGDVIRLNLQTLKYMDRVRK